MLSPGVIGLDIDGVVADFTGAVNQWVSEEHGIEPGPVRSWNWYKEWPDGKKVWNDVWDRGCRKEGLLLRCEPVKYSRAGVAYLTAYGWTVIFVTHRRDEFADDTLRWLHHYGFPTTVVHSDDKSIVGADLYIDDKADTVRSLLEGNNRAFLFAQPWNSEYQGVLPTFKGWQDVMEKIAKWSGNAEQ